MFKGIKSMFGGELGRVDSKFGLKYTLKGFGVPVSGGELAVYDKENGGLTTVPADLVIGDIPVFAFPAFDGKLTVGDAIIHNGAVKYVTAVNDKLVKALNVKTAVNEEIVISKNLFGYANVSKVFTPFEGTLAANGGAGNPMQLLMLSELMGDGDSFGGDDDFSQILLLSQMTGGQGFGNLFEAPADPANPMAQFLPLMLLKGMKD